MTPERRTQIALEWLTERIESLSAMPSQMSQCAYTFSRVAHVAFCNGAVQPAGGAPVPPCEDILETAQRTYDIVKAYRDEILGEALLTWRVKPELRVGQDGASVYCRLAFEPDVWSAQ